MLKRLFISGYNISALLAILLCATVPENDYCFLPFLPMGALGAANILIFPALKKCNSITVLIFLLVIMARYVLLPVCLSLWPIYQFSYYYPLDRMYLSAGCLFLLYELVIVSVFIAFFVRRLKPPEIQLKQREKLGPTEGYGIYMLFVLFALGIWFLFPQARENLNFVKITARTGERFGEQEFSTLEYFLRQIIITGLGCMMITGTLMLKQKRESFLGLNLLLAIAFINIATIVGEQRSTQVYSAFACIFLLCKTFPEHRRYIFITLTGSALGILTLLSLYKHLYVFQMDSYVSAIAETGFNGYELTKNLELYLLGPLTIASVFDFAVQSEGVFTIQRFLLDLLRPFIGISFLVKDSSLDTTTILYNLFVTDNRASNGFLLPISGHCFLYFGYLLAPGLICICYYLAFQLERILINTRSVFIGFWGSYFFIRLASCMVASNIYTVITSFSLVLIFTAGIYCAQRVYDRCKLA